MEQAGFEAGVQAGPDVPGQRELIEQGGVGSFGGGLLQGVELGLGLLALVVELGEPFGNAGPHGGRRGVGRIRGELFEAEDLGVLRGAELLELGLKGGGAGVTLGGGVLVSGGQLGGEQFAAVGAEDVIGEEQADDLVQPGLGGPDGAGVAGVVCGVLGPGRVVRAVVVDQRGCSRRKPASRAASPGAGRAIMGERALIPFCRRR